MSRQNSILGDRFYDKNCYEYLPLRPGYMNANFVGESANPIYNGIRPPKLQRMAPIPASLDVLAVNQSKLYPGSRHNTARQIIDQYVFDEKAYVNPIVNLRQPDLIVNQASNIARPATSQINRGERLLTETISTDALNDSLRLQNTQRGILKLAAEKRAELRATITQVALTGKINLPDYTKSKQIDEMRDYEALLAAGVDTSAIDAIFGSSSASSPPVRKFPSPQSPEVMRLKRDAYDDATIAGIVETTPLDVRVLRSSATTRGTPKEKLTEIAARVRQRRQSKAADPQDDPDVPMSSGSIPPQY